MRLATGFDQALRTFRSQLFETLCAADKLDVAVSSNNLQLGRALHSNGTKSKTWSLRFWTFRNADTDPRFPLLLRASASCWHLNMINMRLQRCSLLPENPRRCPITLTHNETMNSPQFSHGPDWRSAECQKDVCEHQRPARASAAALR